MPNGIYIQTEYHGKLIRKIVCNGEERWFIGSDCAVTFPRWMTAWRQSTVLPDIRIYPRHLIRRPRMGCVFFFGGLYRGVYG